MKPELHERKWEIDSLCYPVRPAHGYWKATGDTSVFDAVWRAAAAAILRTLREQLFGELALRVRAERPHILRERL